MFANDKSRGPHRLRCGFVQKTTIGLLVVLAAAAGPAAAQERASDPDVDSLKAQVVELYAQLDSLRAIIARLQEARGAGPVEPAAAAPSEDETEDPLAALRAAAADALGGESADTAEEPVEATRPGQFQGRQRSQQALNPELTVTADLFAFVNADTPGQDNFVPRVFELSMQSALDPYTRAKVYLGRHAHGGGLAPFEHGHDDEEEPDGEPDAHAEEADPGITLEEGFVEWVNLPGGLGVTVGQFRQRFGTLNRWHEHALPGQQAPLPYMAFLGEEGLTQAGASVHWLAPVSGGGTYESWVQLTRSSNTALFGEDHGLSVLGHVNAFYDLSPSTYLEIGVSGVGGPGAGQGLGTRVGGVDFAFNWRPPERGLYREATLRGGAVYGRLGLPDGTYTDPAWGAFGIGEYRLDRRWIVGARYEYTQNPLEPDESTWLAAPTLTWWQSEYVRIRAEFDYLRRPHETLRQFLIQTTIAMGPHKHENY